MIWQMALVGCMKEELIRSPGTMGQTRKTAARSLKESEIRSLRQVEIKAILLISSRRPLYTLDLSGKHKDDLGMAHRGRNAILSFQKSAMSWIRLKHWELLRELA